MINNLFSIFDPSSFQIRTAWLIIFIPTFIFIQNKNKLNTKWNNIKNIILSEIKKEIKPLLRNINKKGIISLLIIIFIIIILINILALIPFNFTPTAHIIISFPLAITFWVRFMLYGWIQNTKNIIAHTVPTGTPIILINFIVIIEIIRNIIRPLTLAIRLSANIVAGHLLLRLLSNFSLIRTINLLNILPLLRILSILEVGVSLIQAYVFITLITLYSTEIH